MAQPCSILPMPVGQISPSHLGTCLRLPGLGSLRPRLALVSLPISPLGTQPEARCPVPPHGAPKEHNLLLWVHVIVRLGAHGWGGSLVHIGGVASSRVCRGAHKPVGGSGASAGRGSGAPSCLSQVWKDNGPTEPRAPGAGAGPWVPAPCDHAQFSSPGLDQVGWGRE